MTQLSTRAGTPTRADELSAWRVRRSQQEQGRVEGSRTISHEASPQAGPGPTRWARARLALGVAVIVVLVARLGAGPFLQGIRATTLWALAAATGLTALTTLSSAWRWRLVAEGLGVRISLGSAVAAIYRSQFLNATLPGGVLGDVDRALDQARDTGVTGPGVRSVVWERTLGQVVQVALTVAVLVAVPSPLRALGTTAAVIGLLGAVALVAAVPFLRAAALRGLPARLARATGADLRAILRTRRARWGIAAASALAVAGHLLVFLLAAHVAGAPAAAYELLPLAAVVLVAAAVPANLAGWGPREGVAAWSFAAAGLGLASGVTTAVAYGVMALVATLPGAVVLLAGRRTWSRPVLLAPAPVLQEAARG